MTQARIELTGIDKTKAAFDSAHRNLQSLGSSVSALPGKFGTLGLAITAAFSAVTLKGAINTLDQLDDLSEKTGIAVESLSALRYAGEVVGTPLEAIATSTRKLSANMADAAGGNKEAMATFKALGVEVQNADGSLRSQDAVLLDMADRFATYEDGAAKAALAQRAFGKAGADMIPLLNKGSAGIRELRGEAEAMGAVFGGDVAKQAAQFNDNLKRLELNAEAAKVSLLSGLLPALNKVIEGFLRMKQEGLLGTVLKDAAKDMLGFGEITNDVAGDLAKFAAEREKVMRQKAFAERKGLPTAGFDSELERLDKLKRVSQVRQEMLALKDNGDTSDAMSRRMRVGQKKAAPVVPDGAKGDKAAKDAEREAKERAKLLAELNGLSGSFSEDWARLNELFKSGAISLDILTTSQAKLLEQQPFMHERVKSEKELAEVREKATAMADKSLAKMAEENDELAKSNQSLGEQIEMIGLTEEQVKALTLARMEANLQLERERLLQAQNIEGNEAEVAQIERRIQLMEKQKTLTGDKFDKTASAQFTDDLRTDMRGALQRAFEDTKNPGKAFIDAFTSTLYTRVTSRLADAITDGLLGGGSGKGGGGGAGGALLGTIGKLFGFGGTGADSGASAVPSAKGNVFQTPGLSAYSNKVVNRPTVFAFAKGAGIFAEAGPEAIMPLRRGPDGRLGVAAAGGGGQAVTIINQNTFGDVASMQQVEQQQRVSEQRTLRSLARRQGYGRPA